MSEDEIRESWSKLTSISLPKRDELLLRTVFALPKASSSGEEAMIMCASFAANPADEPAFSEHHAM